MEITLVILGIFGFFYGDVVWRYTRNLFSKNLEAPQLGNFLNEQAKRGEFVPVSEDLEMKVTLEKYGAPKMSGARLARTAENCDAKHLICLPKHKRSVENA